MELLRNKKKEKKGQNSSTMGNIVKIENTDIKGSPSSSYGVSYGM